MIDDETTANLCRDCLRLFTPLFVDDELCGACGSCWRESLIPTVAEARRMNLEAMGFEGDEIEADIQQWEAVETA